MARRSSTALPLLLSGFLGAWGCTGEYRVTFIFADAAARDEASGVAAYAVLLATSSGEVVSCDELMGGERHPTDEDVLVARTTLVPFSDDTTARPILQQVDQGRYAFFAEASDRYGFTVARGCQEEEVTASWPLDLRVTMETVTAPSGRLEATGNHELLQHAGALGLETSPGFVVRAVDETGAPQAGIEVRAVVDQGEAVLLNPVEQTDADGVATIGVVAATGNSRVNVHARGLADSPIAFEVSGLPSPAYGSDTVDLGEGSEPEVILAGNFDIDTFVSDDLVILLQEGASSTLKLWRGGPDGGLGWESTRGKETLPRACCIAGGHFDTDDRLDVAVAANPIVTPFPTGEIPSLTIHHHGDEFGDNLGGPRDEVLPAETARVAQLLSVRFNGDDVTDLVVVATMRIGGGDLAAQLLIYRGLEKDESDFEPFIELAEIVPIPAFAGSVTVTAGDVDGDGDDELFLASDLLGIWMVPNGDADGAGSDDYHYFDGITSADWPHIFGGLGVNHIGIADLDEDGVRDLLVVNDGSLFDTGVTLAQFRGDGTLWGLAPRDPAPRTLGLASVSHAQASDFNADGHIDLLLVSNTPPRHAALMGGDGRGRFAQPLVIDLAMSVLSVAHGDINVDGVPDLAFAGHTVDSNYLAVQLSTGIQL